MKLFGKDKIVFLIQTLIVLVFVISSIPTTSNHLYKNFGIQTLLVSEAAVNDSVLSFLGFGFDGNKLYFSNEDKYGFAKIYNENNTPEKAEYLNNYYIPLLKKMYEDAVQTASQQEELSFNYQGQNLDQDREKLNKKLLQIPIDGKEKIGLDTTKERQYINNREKALKEESAAREKSEPIYCLKWGGLGLGSDTGLQFSFPGCLALGSYSILYVSSWILSISASLFDYVIDFSLGMSVIFKEFSAINKGWELLRNLINLFFILILVYISIATILRIESYGYKKLLGKLVIAAVLINFSMFFTKVMIDVSNIISIAFYKQINDRAVQATKESGASPDSKQTHISYGIINALGLQQVWGVGNTIKSKTQSTGATSTTSSVDYASMSKELGGTSANIPLNPWAMVLIGLAGTVFVLMLSFVFFSAGVMFAGRTIMLIGLAVVSPVAFTAGILPQTSKLADGWWKKMRTNLLFAPAYMIMMFIALEMLWADNSAKGGFMALFTAEDFSAIGNVFYFVFMCVLLTMPLVVAASFGAMGSKKMQGWSSAMGKWSKNFAVNRATAPASWAFNKASKSTALAKLATSNSAIGRFVGSRSLQGLDKLAQSKLGGDSSYRSRVDLDKKAIESRMKLSEGLLKQRAGEKDADYYARTGYLAGDFVKKDNESEDAYTKRTKITKEQRDKADSLKKAVYRGYGLTDKGELREGFRGGLMFKGAQLAAQGKIESDSKAKKDSAAKTIEKIRDRLFREIVKKDPRDPSGKTEIKEKAGLIMNSDKLFKIATLKRKAQELINITTKDNVDFTASGIQRLLEKQRVTLKKQKDILRKRAEDLSRQADVASAGPAKDDLEKQYGRQIQKMKFVQDDIDELDKHKNEISASLSKMEDLNVQKSQTEAISNIKIDGK